MTEPTPKPQPKRRRARKPDGKFQGDNPNTEVNEAWEPVEVAPAVQKKVDHKVKPGVKPTGRGGKYAPKPKVRPGQRRVSSTLR